MHVGPSWFIPAKSMWSPYQEYIISPLTLLTAHPAADENYLTGAPLTW